MAGAMRSCRALMLSIVGTGSETIGRASIASHRRAEQHALAIGACGGRSFVDGTFLTTVSCRFCTGRSRTADPAALPLRFGQRWRTSKQNHYQRPDPTLSSMTNTPETL